MRYFRSYGQFNWGLKPGKQSRWSGLISTHICWVPMSQALCWGQNMVSIFRVKGRSFHLCYIRIILRILPVHSNLRRSIKISSLAFLEVSLRLCPPSKFKTCISCDPATSLLFSVSTPAPFRFFSRSHPRLADGGSPTQAGLKAGA